MENLSKEQKREMQRFSIEIRMEVCRMLAHLGAGHLGGSLSIADVLSVLYQKEMKVDPKNPQWEGRDYLVLSKGHAGPALYAALALKGFFPVEELMTLNTPHTKLPSHVDRNKTPGIDMTCGSLGQGCSAASGIALGLKTSGKCNYTYLILGDGESDEGEVWENALFAAQQKLDHLIAFTDCNGLQLDGPTEEVCSVGDLRQKYEDFGWFAQDVDGHDVGSIYKAIEAARAQSGKPSMIVLHTVKAKGWSKAEGQVSSHHRAMSSEDLADALAEMQKALDQCEKEAGSQ